jgi:internalin A
MTSSIIYYQSPLNPHDIQRYWADAGLAFEKHRWLFPTLADPERPVNLFTFGDEPLREIYIHPRFSDLNETEPALTLTQLILTTALPLTPLHLLIISASHCQQSLLAKALIGTWTSPVYLLIAKTARVMLQPFLSQISDDSWREDDALAIVPLLDATTRDRVIDAIIASDEHRFYIIAGLTSPTELPPHLFECFTTRRGLIGADEPEIDYRHFHELVLHCDWVVTSHRQVANHTPFCFYSRNNLQTLLSPLLQDDPPGFMETSVSAFNQAAAIITKSRGGLKLSEIMVAAPITEQTHLSLAWSNLDDLTEISALQSLQYLNLDGTLIDQVDALATLLQLQSLSLKSLQIEDLTPLTSLPRLHHLALDHFPKAGLAPLATILALNSLDLDRLPIETTASLPTCSALKRLSLSRTRLNTLDDIARLSSLEHLFLTSTSITDLAPLIALPSLQTLVIDNCPITDFTPLLQILTLQFLSLAQLDYPPRPLPDVRALTEITTLKHLCLRNTIFDNLSPGIATNSLISLDLSGCWISELYELTKFNALRCLTLAHSPLTDVNLLVPLTQLETLDISFCKISDLTGLRRFEYLQALNLDFTEVIDLQPLVNLHRLRSLSLAGLGENVADQFNHPLEVLRQMSTIEGLNISGWQFDSTAWLTSLKSIRSLNLSGTNLQRLQPISEMSELRDLDLSQTAIRSLDGLEQTQKLQRINLNSTLIQDLSPIRYAIEIEQLSLRNTPVKNLTALATFKNLKRLDLRGVPMGKDLSPLLDLPRLELLLLDSHGVNLDILDNLIKRHRVVLTPT